METRHAGTPQHLVGKQYVPARFPVGALGMGIFQGGLSIPTLDTLDRLGAVSLYGVAGQLGTVFLLGTVATLLAILWRRAGLRLLELEENKHKALKSALELGEKSKKIDDFDSKKYLKNLHTKHL